MATLRGNVRRITFRNDANHFTVAKLEVDEPDAVLSGELATVVGYFPSLRAGEWLEVDGEWTMHDTFGLQFQVSAHRKTPPATARGILRYLGSGAVEGIGPKLAERLVAKFGERTLDVIENEPERLLEVEGIGEAKLRAIGRAVRGDKEVRDALVFLEGLGIAPGTAGKIYRHYKDETIAKVRENPYRLADDIFGIGFRTADAVAREMGIPADSPKRAAAALVYLLSQAGQQGHVYLPRGELLALAAGMEIPEQAARSALTELESAREVVVERERPGEALPGSEEEWAVYPSFLHFAEVEVARLLAERIPLSNGSSAHDHAGETVQLDLQLDVRLDVQLDRAGLSDEQRLAVARALSPGGGLMVLTGGPGTGKTTTLRAIVEGLKSRGFTYHLAAPTGRAAKRLSEATGEEAKTLHRLLEYSGGGEAGGFQFQRNERSPLRTDAVIVDEASMIDLPLLFHLLRAVPAGAKVILVGDADQLPSVGPGNVLRDVLAAAPGVAIRLTQVFRQAQESRIVTNAHRIQRGQRPISGGEGSDFFFIAEEDPEKAKELICDLVARRLPKYLGCDPIRDVQVLATVRRGSLGVESLNAALQKRLNPHHGGRPEAVLKGQRLRAGDRVMQVRNDYDKMVFNGDIGTVSAVDPSTRTLEVVFPDRDEPGPVVYQGEDVQQLTLAYCTSVHKSQGSEYPAVVMPINWVMPALMNRNLLYTAVTRARRLVVLVGREDALWAYVRNDKADRRFTRLAERIEAAVRTAGTLKF